MESQKKTGEELIEDLGRFVSTDIKDFIDTQRNSHFKNFASTLEQAFNQISQERKSLNNNDPREVSNFKGMLEDLKRALDFWIMANSHKKEMKSEVTKLRTCFTNVKTMIGQLPKAKAKSTLIKNDDISELLNNQRPIQVQSLRDQISELKKLASLDSESTIYKTLLTEVQRIEKVVEDDEKNQKLNFNDRSNDLVKAKSKFNVGLFERDAVDSFQTFKMKISSQPMSANFSHATELRKVTTKMSELHNVDPNNQIIKNFHSLMEGQLRKINTLIQQMTPKKGVFARLLPSSTESPELTQLREFKTAIEEAVKATVPKANEKAAHTAAASVTTKPISDTKDAKAATPSTQQTATTTASQNPALARAAQAVQLAFKIIRAELLILLNYREQHQE